MHSMRDHPLPTPLSQAGEGADRVRARRTDSRRRTRIMGETRKIALTVNGKRYEEEVEVRSTLADFLRHQLGLTGTHLGCEHGVCGACTILLDGRSARSCLMLAVQANGHEILTVEGIAPGARQAASAAGGVPRQSRPAVRLLHARHADHADSNSCATIRTRPSRRCGSRSPAISAAAPAIRASSSRRSTPPSGCANRRSDRRCRASRFLPSSREPLRAVGRVASEASGVGGARGVPEPPPPRPLRHRSASLRGRRGQEAALSASWPFASTISATG